MNSLWKWLLLPFTLCYALGVALRLLLYRTGLLVRTEFDIPVVCIGNLAAGGTGKTPHTDWLVSKLKATHRLAILSRGYGRKTVGYVAAHPQITAAELGDEPLLLYHKHQIPVVACESRVLGVPSLLADFPETDCILMDDGFQHLPIRPGLSIVLTAYHNRFTQDWLLPSGRLREFRSGYHRADIIIVTKCPADLSETERKNITKEINPLPHQQVLFSHIGYMPMRYANGNEAELSSDAVCILVTAIADAGLLKQHIQGLGTLIHHMEYSDHHAFTQAQVHSWLHLLKQQHARQTYIVCTEKDAVKLSPYMNDLEPYLLVAPIAIQMHATDEAALLSRVTQFIHSFPTHTEY